MADFYGPVVPNADHIALYLLTFHPQLSPNERFLLLPGIGGYSHPNGDLGTGLWLADRQDNVLRQLLPQAKAATWSPDSAEIAYVEGDTLYKLAIDEEAAPMPLFSHPELQERYARWSPDGRWVAAVTTTLESPQETDSPTSTDTFWLVSTMSEAPFILAQRPGFATGGGREWMSWSADGQYLLIQGQNEVLDRSGRQISPPLPGAASWLPDQSGLLVNGREGLRLMTIAGQELARISSKFASTWAFSHDDNRLAYSPRVEDGSVEIFIFDLDEQRSQRIGSLHLKPLRKINRLRWSNDDMFLIMDDMEADSPIWIMKIDAESKAEPLIERAILIEVIDTWAKLP